MEPKSKSYERHWPQIRPILYRLGTTREGTLRNMRYASLLLDPFEDPRQIGQADVDAIREDVLTRFKTNGARTRLVNLRTILRRVYGRHDLVLKPPRPEAGPKDVFEATDYQRILDSARPDECLYAALWTQYGATLRPGELRRLNVEDVDLDGLEVRIRKAKRGERVVNLPPQAAEAVRAWLRERPAYRDAAGEALFVAVRGGAKARGAHRIGRDWMNHRLKVLAASLGVAGRAYPHMVRASGITHLLNAGVNPDVVRRQAGHGKLETTWTYNRPTRGDARRIMREAFGQIANRSQEDPISVRRAPKDPDETAQELLDAYRRGELDLQELRTLLNVGNLGRSKDRSLRPNAPGYA